MDNRKRFSIILLSVLCLVCILSCRVFAAPDSDDQSFLSAEQAFTLKVEPIKGSDRPQAKVRFTIAPDYLLYQEHFKFRTLKNQPIPEKSITLPKALSKKDEDGEYKVYKNQLDLILPLDQTEMGFRVQYQGCGEAGFCYPPISKEVQFLKDGTVHISELSSEAFEAVSTATVSPEATESEVDLIAGSFQNKSVPFTLLGFLGLGLLLAFTPCVLPMVPILANILVGQDQPLSRKRSFTLSGLYVFSVALCYAAAGLAAGLLGSHLSTSLQQPIFLVSLSFLLLLFALSQFNIIHVQLPVFLSHTLKKLEVKHHKQGSALGAISMGAVSALMVSPCVTPALVGALTYIGQTGDALLGGLALFFLALGMGLPLLIAACIGSHLLPKAGHWMNYLKSATGLLLLVLAVSTLMRAVPLNSETTLASASSVQTAFTQVRSPSELIDALKIAQAQKKPVMLDVYADWCVSCRQMDKEVFEDKSIQEQLKDVHLLRLDLSQQNKLSDQLQKELGIIGPPMVLFFWPNGQEATSYRLAGKPKSANFSEIVGRFLKHSIHYSNKPLIE